MQRTLGFIIGGGAIALGVVMIIMAFRANYHWQQEYSSYWNLADKASTISQKSEYIDKFVSALEKSGLQGTNDALIWKTNDTSFDKNFEALKSLQVRLQEIKTMNPSSFEYQTAIQQITAQEQGEATAMLGVLKGCWFKVHYYWLWNIWLILLVIGVVILGTIIGGILFFEDSSPSYY